ncbi:MAG: ATP-binding cassette domain-containing protein [Pseudomonadota bacterium]
MTATADSRIGWDVAVRTELTEEEARAGVLGGFTALTDVAACLLPLLSALEWDGDMVHVAEALPHFADTLDITDLLGVMANLGFAARSLRSSTQDIDERLMPCLFVPDDGDAVVLLHRTDEEMVVEFSPAVHGRRTVAPSSAAGTAYLFRRLTDEEKAGADASLDTTASTLRRFRALLARTLAASLVSNLVVIATPLFIMSVYDKYLPTGSTTLLMSMLAGVGLALAGDHAIRVMRGRMVAFMGARLDYLMGMAVFRRLLFLPPSYMELASPNAQMARLRDFEMVREFFTGPLATTLAELPFSAVFVVLLAVIGGPLVFVPIGASVIFVIAAVLARPLVKDLVAAAGREATKRQEFLTEAIGRARTIKEAGAADVWLERHRVISAEAAHAGHRAARANAVVAVASQILVVSTGLVTLAWGVERVLTGSMTVGALMASMMIVWWVLRPLQTGFALLSQIERARLAMHQIDRLLQLKPERAGEPTGQRRGRVKGKIALSNVSLRYKADADPAILGVSLQIAPGEIVALVGPNGAGKTTLLKMILGMYRPQTGSVLIDDVDIRQIDPIEMRRAIAYVPQKADMFFGTVAQNLRLVRATASDAELRWACEEAGVLDEILALPRGFDTRLGDGLTDGLPTSFRQRLSLARAYLKRAPITLFDEPAGGLDFVADRQFMLTLERMRGHSTIVLVTHRPSHLKLADKIVVLGQGQVRMAGPAKQVLERLPPGFL